MDTVETEVQAPEQPGAEDEATWSRAWEWPAWLRALGRVGRGDGTVRGWRPDPRTLAVLLAIVAATQLPGAIVLAKPSWQEAFHPRFVDFPSSHADLTRWERAFAGSYLGVLLGSALTFLAVPLLLAWPRRLAGYLPASMGLLVSFGAAVAGAVAIFHVIPVQEERVSYVGEAGGALLLLLFTLYVALRRRAPSAA